MVICNCLEICKICKSGKQDTAVTSMGSTGEKLLKSLVLKIVSLRDARFSFLCCIKMQMEIYQQVGFWCPTPPPPRPRVKLETVGSQIQSGIV